MLLNEIAHFGMNAQTINKQMKVYGSNVEKFQELLAFAGLPDNDDEILEVKFLGWDGDHYRYVCIAEDNNEGGFLVAYFLVNFNKKGELSGDYPGNPIAEFEDEADADEKFETINK